jgi:hypothetical protein
MKVPLQLMFGTGWNERGITQPDESRVDFNEW